MKVVITGATGALGAAAIKAFRAAGHGVIGIDAATLSDSGLIGGVDLARSEAAAAAFATASTRLGGVDVLVNIAGGFTFEPVLGAPRRGTGCSRST